MLVGGTPLRMPETLTGKLGGLTVRSTQHVSTCLLAVSMAIGLNVLGQMMDGEATTLAGPKGCRDPDRAHVRRGTEDGAGALRGRKAPTRRPRSRATDDASKTTLEVCEVAHAEDLLAEHLVVATPARPPGGLEQPSSPSVPP